MGSRRTWSEWAAVGVIGCTFGIDVSCLDTRGNNAPNPGPARALDSACASGRCMRSGSAAISMGLTADTTGVRLGPEEGEVTFILPRDDANGFTFGAHFQVLLSGAGSFTIADASCAATATARARTSPADYQWVEDSDCAPPTSGTVTVRVAKGSVVDIVDIRLLYEQNSPGCE